MIGVGDVVLERTAETIIGESFAKLDNGYQKGGPWQLVGDSAEGLHLYLSGPVCFEVGEAVGIREPRLILQNSVKRVSTKALMVQKSVRVLEYTH